jgi:hypothetical protein
VKTPEEFDAFVRDELAPRLRRVESERRAVRERRDALAVSPAWKVAGLAGGVALALWGKAFAGFLAGAAAPFVVEAFRKRSVPDTATPLVRSTLLAPAITFWDASFRYAPNGCISRAEFEASRLFEDDGSVSEFAGEDLVTGRNGATEFRFSELRVKHVERSGKRNRTRVIFHGLFFVADCNKAFHGETLVLPDVAEGVLGSFGRAFQSLASGAAGLQLVELESPDFERAFTVRSTDPVEARYLLSTSLMQRILTFSQNCGGGLRIGFLRGRVYVAIALKQDLFSTGGGLASLLAPLAKPVTLEDVRRWGSEVLFATSIVDELDLNTRIWSKATPAA